MSTLHVSAADIIADATVAEYRREINQNAGMPRVLQIIFGSDAEAEICKF